MPLRKLLAVIAFLAILATSQFATAYAIAYFPPPLKQIRSGTAPEHVTCTEGLELVLKSTNGSPACVKASTAMKLKDRGWGTALELFMIEERPTYNPKITPSDFVSEINNKFFTLVPGTTFIYEAETEDGLERIEVYVTNRTKTVLEVNTIEVLDRVWLNDELIEETLDWYAQDMEGNVWYFGEDSNELAGGMVVSTKGSWEAGVDGAKPGIIMKASPHIGDSYRQEYYVGQAEDMGEVVALSETVTVPYGTFSDCLKTKDWTPLEPDVIEFKYYCPETGSVVLETIPEGEEKVELIAVESSHD